MFFEDEVMLEAQQRGIEANPGYDFYNLNIDAGSMWTRRMVSRMIAAESGTDGGTTADGVGPAQRGDLRGERADRQRRPDRAGRRGRGRRRAAP